MEMKALHHHGWTVSALAREFGLCRDTVRRELDREGLSRRVCADAEAGRRMRVLAHPSVQCS